MRVAHKYERAHIIFERARKSEQSPVSETCGYAQARTNTTYARHVGGGRGSQ